jgi:hypothetical protein
MMVTLAIAVLTIQTNAWKCEAGKDSWICQNNDFQCSFEEGSEDFICRPKKTLVEPQECPFESKCKFVFKI